MNKAVKLVGGLVFATVLGVAAAAPGEETIAGESVDIVRIPAGVGCGYIARYNAKAYTEPTRRIPTGSSYQAGIFPILDRFPDGTVKTVDWTGLDLRGRFSVVYLAAEDVALDWRNTAWGQEHGSYDAPTALPRQCPPISSSSK